MNPRLIAKRKKMGLNQYEIARLAGLQPWKITFAESDRRPLTPDELKAVRRVLTPRKAKPKKSRAA